MKQIPGLIRVECSVFFKSKHVSRDMWSKLNRKHEESISKKV